MNPDDLLQKAIALAEKAHDGQLDKAGEPYLSHPIRVMNNLIDPTDKIVGVLHDAVEDSELTLGDLTTAGFPVAVVDAVNAITKRDGETYEDYLQRVMANPIALRVKIADMTDNMDNRRIAQPTEADHKRMRKYQTTLPRLKEALARLGGQTE